MACPAFMASIASSFRGLAAVGVTETPSCLASSGPNRSMSTSLPTFACDQLELTSVAVLRLDQHGGRPGLVDTPGPGRPADRGGGHQADQQRPADEQPRRDRAD